MLEKLDLQLVVLKDLQVPFNQEGIAGLLEGGLTPFYIYDQRGIEESVDSLYRAFEWSGNFKNYFAVKALPTPAILRVLKDKGMGVDCSSMMELRLAEEMDFRGKEIMFTSNNTPAVEYKKAVELGAIINLDDISHIDFLEENAGIPETICFRYNPGLLREGNSIIGKPEEAKYGLTKEQLIEAYGIMKNKGVKEFGLHTMIASNELKPEYFMETAKMLFALVKEIKDKTGVEISFVDLGGGIGIPYRPEQEKVDLEVVGHGIKKLYKEMIEDEGLSPVRITMECGRLITGPHGYLVTEAIHFKDIYKKYIGVDACMADLMRPGMYGAYHHITVLGEEKQKHDCLYDVTGSLCENNDKFAIDRWLPSIDKGDILVIHDAGAHGRAMGFNYNGKLRPAEYLMENNGKLRMIRRPEDEEDYFATFYTRDGKKLF
jgi:diaminopimelate decarboxylase